MLLTPRMEYFWSCHFLSILYSSLFSGLINYAAGPPEAEMRQLTRGQAGYDKLPISSSLPQYAHIRQWRPILENNQISYIDILLWRGGGGGGSLSSIDKYSVRRFFLNFVLFYFAFAFGGHKKVENPLFSCSIYLSFFLLRMCILKCVAFEILHQRWAQNPLFCCPISFCFFIKTVTTIVAFEIINLIEFLKEW